MGINGKFMHEFKEMCENHNYGIKAKQTTSHNQSAIRKYKHSENKKFVDYQWHA
jgi:hypothetical protein